MFKSDLVFHYGSITIPVNIIINFGIDLCLKIFFLINELNRRFEHQLNQI
jgi:hypothetical protein